MADTAQKTDASSACPPDAHIHHLCHLQCEGYHYGHRAEYKALVQDAQYLCRNCGRTAKRAENLCAPTEL